MPKKHTLSQTQLKKKKTIDPTITLNRTATERRTTHPVHKEPPHFCCRGPTNGAFVFPPPTESSNPVSLQRVESNLGTDRHRHSEPNQRTHTQTTHARHHGHRQTHGWFPRPMGRSSSLPRRRNEVPSKREARERGRFPWPVLPSAATRTRTARR